MSQPLEIPALDGRDPLGFLASLGLLRVLTATRDNHTRLSFSTATGNAVIHSKAAGIQDVVGALADLVARTDEESAIPGVTAAFPPRPASRKRRDPDAEKIDESDPMRVTRTGLRDLVDRITHTAPEAAAEWLPHLVTDLAVDNNGRAALTPFTAPSGKQNLRTFFSKPLQAVRAEPAYLDQALLGWRRIDNFTGEYLDHRVLNSQADHPTGTSTEAGVPGATWLATMALPLLRLTGDGNRPAATLWYRHNRRHLMIWPLWHPPLGVHAVQVLLEHPALQPGNNTVTDDARRALGVFATYAAERQPIPGRKSAGVLAPTEAP